MTNDKFFFDYINLIYNININGLNHVDAIEKIGNHYNLHPLTLEDIVNTSHRPKIDDYTNYVFIVLKMIYYDKDEQVVTEQVSFILGDNYVISFQEAEGDVFDSVRDRLRFSKGRIRGLGSDYLLYALIDAVTDTTRGSEIYQTAKQQYVDQYGPVEGETKFNKFVAGGLGAGSMVTDPLGIALSAFTLGGGVLPKLSKTYKIAKAESTALQASSQLEKLGEAAGLVGRQIDDARLDKR